MFNEDFKKEWSHCCSDTLFPFFTIMFTIFFTIWLIEVALLAEELYYGWVWWEVYPFWMIILILIPIPLIVYFWKKMHHHGTEIFVNERSLRTEGPSYNIFLSEGEIYE